LRTKSPRKRLSWASRVLIGLFVLLNLLASGSSAAWAANTSQPDGLNAGSYAAASYCSPGTQQGDFSCLPAWRWNGIAANFHENLAPSVISNFGDVTTEIGRSFASILFGIASFLWGLVLFVIQTALGAPIISGAGRAVDSVFAAVGAALLGQGNQNESLVFLVLMATAVVAALGMVRRGVGYAVKRVLASVIPIALLIVMMSGANAGVNSASSARPVGSPSWLLERVYGDVQYLGNIFGDIQPQASSTAVAAVPTSSTANPLSCASYEQQLRNDFSLTSNPQVYAASSLTSNIWEQTYLTDWANAQFGSNPLADQFYCRYLDTVAQVPPNNQAVVMSQISNIPPGMDVYATGQGANQGIFAPWVGSQLNENAVAWAACRWGGAFPPNQWTVANSFAPGYGVLQGTAPYPNPADCWAWWNYGTVAGYSGPGSTNTTTTTTTEGTPSTSSAGVTQTAAPLSQLNPNQKWASSIQGDSNGNYDSPFVMCAQTLPQQERDVNTQPAGGGNYGLNSLDYCETWNGHNASSAILDGFVALGSAVAFSIVMGGLGIGMILAQVGLVLLFALLPFLLLVIALPTEHSSTIAKRYAKLAGSMLFTSVLFVGLLAVLSLLIGVVDTLLGSLVGSNSGIASSLLYGIAPVAVLIGVRRVAKNIGLHHLFSIRGALHAPFASAAMMGVAGAGAGYMAGREATRQHMPDALRRADSRMEQAMKPKAIKQLGQQRLGQYAQDGRKAMDKVFAGAVAISTAAKAWLAKRKDREGPADVPTPDGSDSQPVDSPIAEDWQDDKGEPVAANPPVEADVPASPSASTPNPAPNSSPTGGPPSASPDAASGPAVAPEVPVSTTGGFDMDSEQFAPERPTGQTATTVSEKATEAAANAWANPGVPHNVNEPGLDQASSSSRKVRMQPKTPPPKFSTKVVGVSYLEGYPDNLSRLNGARLVLQREPDNPYDPGAVAVMALHEDGRSERVGYIGRGLAERLAPSLDQGHQWEIPSWQVIPAPSGQPGGLNINISRSDLRKEGEDAAGHDA